MAQRSGLGETGETFLVGPDMVMRTSSHLLSEDTVLRRRVDTEPVRRALNGATGHVFSEDYRREQVLVAYTPLEFGDLDWVVIAKIDRAEALAATRVLLIETMIVVVVATIVIVMLSLVISRGIALPLRQTARAAVRLAQGDLKVELLSLRREDEVGELGLIRSTAWSRTCARYRANSRRQRPTGGTGREHGGVGGSILPGDGAD